MAHSPPTPERQMLCGQRELPSLLPRLLSHPAPRAVTSTASRRITTATSCHSTVGTALTAQTMRRGLSWEPRAQASALLACPPTVTTVRHVHLQQQRYGPRRCCMPAVGSQPAIATFLVSLPSPHSPAMGGEPSQTTCVWLHMMCVAVCL